MKKKILMRMIGWRLNVLALINPKKAAREAFYLFCYPIRTPLPDYQLQFLEESKHETFTYGKDTIQTYKWGNGERKVLLLHGWRSHAFRWKRYVEALAENHTVYALDAPGHGLSSGKYLSLPYYGEVIEHYVGKLGGVDTIVGHSIGGFASLYTLHRAPSLAVNKLVVMGAPGKADEFVGFFKDLLRLSDRTIELMLEYFEKKFGNGPDYYSSATFGQSLSVPGLIIHDQMDLEASVQHAHKLSRAWKQAELVITDGLGHNLKSDDVVNRVSFFVDGMEKAVPLPVH